MSTDRAERLLERFQTSQSPQPPRHSEPTKPSWEEINQRFTVWLPRRLVAQIKALAQQRDESIATVVARALRAELSQTDQTKGPPSAVHGTQ